MRLLIVFVLLVAPLCAAATAAGAAAPAEGWVWYYQHVTPADGAKFAGARVVVVADQADDGAAIATIHARGALAYHYVNVYWYPGARLYEGVDMSQDQGWAFCNAGSQPAVGRVKDGVPWYYADLNEQGMYDAVLAYLRSLRRAGYDGVFFDLGTAALANAAIGGRTSTCTAQPVAPGATFADAFARTVRAAAGLGLHVVLNYTTRRPLRPDVAAVVQRTLYETPPDATLAGFEAAFRRRRAEQAAWPARRYVEEVETSRPGDRAGAYYQWAQAALWRVGIAVNTGDDACAASVSTAGCGRYGTFPELTAVSRGAAMDAAPSSRRCARGSAVACLWVRRWQRALVMVNTTPAPLRVTVSTGHPRCRTFTDLWRRRVLHRGACTLKLTVTVPARSGRVYTERFP